MLDGICAATAFVFGGKGDPRGCWTVMETGEELSAKDLLGTDREAFERDWDGKVG